MHALNAIGYKPCGTVVASCQVGEKQVVAFVAHFVSLLGKLRLGKGHVPCGFAHLVAIFAPYISEALP